MNPKTRRRPSFEERFVAFVDILGFRDIVDRMKREPELFSTVRDALKTIDKQARDFSDYRQARKHSHQALLAKGKAPLTSPSHLQMSAFSDCYVISESSPAWHVLAGVQALGATLLTQGILCRGAVVKGPMYHRNRVLFGPAVIEAYDLERQVAKYPRILVTEEVRKATWGYHEGVWKEKLFIQDADGRWFINVLTPSMSEWSALSVANADMTSREFLKTVGSQLSRQLQARKGDLVKMSKLLWLSNHFNRVAEQRGKVELLVLPGMNE